MDEPFSNLDRGLRGTIRAETIAPPRGLGTSVIMVTHDPIEALSSGDQVVLMRSGRIVQAGSGRDLHDRPSCAYVAEFLCTFNKIEGMCANGSVHMPLGQFEAPGFADGEQATVYIRPYGPQLDCEGPGLGCTTFDCTLRGEIEQIILALTALPEPLKIRSTERRNLHVGDKARIRVAAGRVLVF